MNNENISEPQFNAYYQSIDSIVLIKVIESIEITAATNANFEEAADDDEVVCAATERYQIETVQTLKDCQRKSIYLLTEVGLLTPGQQYLLYQNLDMGLAGYGTFFNNERIIDLSSNMGKSELKWIESINTKG